MRDYSDYSSDRYEPLSPSVVVVITVRGAGSGAANEVCGTTRASYWCLWGVVTRDKEHPALKSR